jgi:hypothetical protein
MHVRVTRVQFPSVRVCVRVFPSIDQSKSVPACWCMHEKWNSRVSYKGVNGLKERSDYQIQYTVRHIKNKTPQLHYQNGTKRAGGGINMSVWITGPSQTLLHHQPTHKSSCPYIGQLLWDIIPNGKQWYSGLPNGANNTANSFIDRINASRPYWSLP